MSEESTTPDLVELVRRSYEPIATLDVDGIMSFFGPEAVFDLPGGLGAYRGRAAIRGFLEDWVRLYDSIENDLEERTDLGGGVAFVICHQTGHLAGGGGEVGVRFAAVAVWEDGLIVSATNNQENFDEARAAAERLAQERG